MPFLKVNGQWLMVNRQGPAHNRIVLRSRKSIYYSQFTIHRFGYSLIELLIVIAIFGITISLVTASYLTFERNQRFKNAALQLKSDIRYAQNLAVTGEKGADSEPICPKDTAHALGGWYLRLTQPNATSYELSGMCLTKDASGNITGQSIFGTKTLILPRGVRVSGISSGPSTSIFFQPLGQDAIFTTTTPSSVSPSTFFNADGTWRASTSSAPLTITLNSTSASGTYNVIVQSTGEVNETKL